MSEQLQLAMPSTVVSVEEMRAFLIALGACPKGTEGFLEGKEAMTLQQWWDASGPNGHPNRDVLHTRGASQGCWCAGKFGAPTEVPPGLIRWFRDFRSAGLVMEMDNSPL